MTLVFSSGYSKCMIQKLEIPVSVVCVFNHKTRSFMPKKVLFENKEYLIKKLGYHHTFCEGRTLFHVFSVSNDTMFFKLVFNTQNLSWILEEISDDNAFGS